MFSIASASVEEETSMPPSQAFTASISFGVTHIMSSANTVALAVMISSGGRIRCTALKACRVWTGKPEMMALFISKTLTCSSSTCSTKQLSQVLPTASVLSGALAAVKEACQQHRYSKSEL